MADRIKNQNKCVVCGSVHQNIWNEVVDYSVSKETFILADCMECGFRFTQNPPAEADCAPYYDSQNYVSHSDTQEGVLYWLYHKVRSFMLSRKASLIRKLGSGKNILDVGCGTGYFAGYMAGMGYSVHGIEVDEKARTLAQEKFSIPVSPPPALLDGNITGRFHFITLWHVLEHLYDPDRYWAAFHRLLDDHGFLIVALPNHRAHDAQHYGQYWAGYDVPRHLWHFTPKTMEMMAERNHFRLCNIQSMPFDPFYNSLLSEKYKGTGFVWPLGLLIGGIAMIKGFFNTKKASSVIYILQKSNV